MVIAMVVFVQRLGGIGNQLFQVATGIAYSKQNGFPLVISNKTDPKRQSYNDTVFKNYLKYSRLSPDTLLHREPRFTFTSIPRYDKSVLLYGYYQSANYFAAYRDELVNAFTYPTRIVIPLEEETVAIHVRRSDYLPLANYHAVQGIDYYTRALHYITQHINKNHKLIIFSDDIAWCKEQAIFKQGVFIEHTTDLEDLYNMSLCNHFITANSSFSWWGSYLSTKRNKIIIAPKRWFGPEGSPKWDTVYLPDTIKL